MIAILGRLFSKRNPFLYSSNVGFCTGIVEGRIPPPLPSVYDMYVYERRLCVDLSPRPSVYEILVYKYLICPFKAQQVTSYLPERICPKKAESTLSFLKEYGFMMNQVMELIEEDKELLLPEASIVDFKLKFKLLEDLGLSPKEVAKLITINPSVLHLSIEDKIIPSVSNLMDFLGSGSSREGVAKVLRKTGFPLVMDFGESLFPNVEILKSYGIPMNRMLAFFYRHPEFFFEFDMRDCVERAIQVGVSPTSKSFLPNVFFFTSKRDPGVNYILKSLRDTGFSECDAFTMIKNAPLVFLGFHFVKIMNKIQLVLATGKYGISDIVANPSFLRFSIQKRLKQRLQILQSNQIEECPSLSAMCGMSRAKFEERFLVPYTEKH